MQVRLGGPGKSRALPSPRLLDAACWPEVLENWVLGLALDPNLHAKMLTTVLKALTCESYLDAGETGQDNGSASWTQRAGQRLLGGGI